MYLLLLRRLPRRFRDLVRLSAAFPAPRVADAHPRAPRIPAVGRMVAIGVSAAMFRAPSGRPRGAFRHRTPVSTFQTTTKTWRAPTPSRVSLADAARVSYAYHASRARGGRGGAGSGAFARANVGHASRSPVCHASSSGFSSSETPEPTSSRKRTHSRHDHLARRLALALAVVTLVAFVVAESCGARASFPSGATRESFTRTAAITFETLRPGGFPPPAAALLRDARSLFDKARPSLAVALMAFLSFNPAPTRRVSRESFHALARCLAARGAPGWVTAATALSGPYVGRAARLCACWALANRLALSPRVDTDVVLAAPPIVRALAATVASVFGQSSRVPEFDVPSLTVGETRAWFFVASARVLVAALCVLAAQWVMHAKRPPPRPASFAEPALSGEALGRDAAAAAGDKPEEDKSDPVARHFAALRGDAGVSWDRQAKAALVDSALSCFVVAASVLSVANALRVDVTGLLAVGGFSGVAFGFAAQRCVANFISGVLIFVTQPFKAGDLVATAHAAGEGAFRGVVKQVGWHSTSLESCKDGSVLIVPNSELSTVPVRNVSRRERRAVLETVPVSIPLEGATRGGSVNQNIARARAAVFAANRALRAHVGVEPPHVSDRVDGAATPRCVLTADPATGATRITCAYVMARSVPEPYAEAVRSAVLVKLREAVAAALVVDERAAEGTSRAFACVPPGADVPVENRIYVIWRVPSEAAPVRAKDLWDYFSRFGELAFCNLRPSPLSRVAGRAFVGFASPGGAQAAQSVLAHPTHAFRGGELRVKPWWREPGEGTGSGDAQEEEEDSEEEEEEDSDSAAAAEASEASEEGFDGTVLRELTGHHDHHFPQPLVSSPSRASKRRSTRRERQNTSAETRRRVARSMRRGEREYEAASGRYRDEDGDGDACW